MESEIKNWLENVASNSLSNDPQDESYWVGYADGQVVLADRILSVLKRIENDNAH